MPLCLFTFPLYLFYKNSSHCFYPNYTIACASRRCAGELEAVFPVDSPEKEELAPDFASSKSSVFARGSMQSSVAGQSMRPNCLRALHAPFMELAEMPAKFEVILQKGADAMVSSMLAPGLSIVTDVLKKIRSALFLLFAVGIII